YAFLAVELPAVLVHALEICFRFRSGLIVAPLQAPDVEPVRGTGAVHAEKIQAHRNPLVDVLLNDLQWNHASLDNTLDAILPGAEMKGLFLEHGNHGLRQRRESGEAEHGELVFAVAIHKIRVHKKVQPIVDVLIKGAEQTLLVEGAPLQHLL